jgi:hypothetical protein
VNTHPAVFGRNYFIRPSAPDHLSAEEDEERRRILQDAKALRQFAVYFLHPELPVEVADPVLYGRNFFTRISAHQQVSEDDAERTVIMKVSKALHRLAVDYRHPEVPVVTTDPTVFGRNYFTRPSAPGQESEEDAESKLILEDVKGLHKMAVDYHHPEIPTVASDPTIFGRNYFTRPSAAPPTTMEDDDEEELVMIEAGRLEQLALDYYHPELPVRPRDPAALGRKLLAPPSIKDTGTVIAMAGNETEDMYWHHANFDLEDHIHHHHADFDRNKIKHDEISCLRFASPISTRKVIQRMDQPIPSSPGCVMTFVHPEDISCLPQLP